MLAGLVLGALLGFLAEQAEISWLATTLARIGEVFVCRKAAVNLGVPRGYASLAVPLGTTTKMDGCAAVFPAPRRRRCRRSSSAPRTGYSQRTPGKGV